jgi:hypothetical protein
MVDARDLPNIDAKTHTKANIPIFGGQYLGERKPGRNLMAHLGSGEMV